MSSISSLNAGAALLILQQASLSFAPVAGRKAPAADIVAIANGVSKPGVSVAGGPAQQAWGKITESVFDSKLIDITEMKARLFERLGKELGLSMDDFGTASDFGRAVKAAINSIRMQDDGDLVLGQIERKLELGELGISLDTLVEAMIDPEGDADERLEEALRRQAGEDDDKAEALADLRSFTLDEIGVYGL